MATTIITPEKARIKIEVTGIDGGLLTVTRRHPSGRILPVRGMNLVALSGGAFVGYDYEAPIGVQVTYVASAYADPDTLLSSSDAVTATWTTTNEWLKDPLDPIRNMPIRVNDMSEWDYASPTAVHTVLGRPDPVTVGEVRQAATGDVTFVTLDKDERDRFHFLTSSGHVLLLQSSQDSGVGNMYIASLGIRETRVGTRDQAERLWAMTYQEVAMPVGAAGPVVTYQDLLDTYATYQAVKASAYTYTELYENLSSTTAPPSLAWRGS